MRTWIILILAVLLFNCNTTSSGEIIDGILEVPENRNNPKSRTLNLVYKVLKAKDTSTQKAPIVFLQGGPGGKTLILEEFWKNHPLRNDRDIVLMDQRGTGDSEANCADLGKAMFRLLRKDHDVAGEIKALEIEQSKCKKAMKKDSIDLAGYNSRENAADFEDLRKTLGYKEWNLFGGSYGSRLGLTIMRDFPNGVRSAVLSGIFAPQTDFIDDSYKNFENSLFSVLTRCKENEACNNRYPNLKERLLKVLEKLESKPLRINFENEPLVINRQDAIMLIFVSLYDRNSIAHIPQLIEAFENEDIEPIKNVLNGIQGLYDLVNWSMNNSVLAYEEVPFFDEDVIEKSLAESQLGFEPASAILSMKSLTNWHPFRASDVEDQAVVSEIPTLMVSGGLDHVTPVSNAKKTLKHLKNGYELIFPDEAHNLYNPCFFEIAEDFLNNPLQKPNMDCSITRNPIEWDLSK